MLIPKVEIEDPAEKIDTPAKFVNLQFLIPIQQQKRKKQQRNNDPATKAKKKTTKKQRSANHP